MSDYLLAGFGLGIALIAAHVLISIRAGERPALEAAVVLVVSAISVSTGIKVVVICVTADSLVPFTDEDRVYVALGGIALTWVSLIAINTFLTPRN